MEAEHLIANEILGLNHETVLLAGKAYTIYPPSIITLSRVVRHLEDMPDMTDKTNIEILKITERHARKDAKGLAEAILHGDKLRPVKLYFLRRELYHANGKELKDAVNVFMQLSGAADFFVSAVTIGAAQQIIHKPEEITP